MRHMLGVAIITIAVILLSTFNSARAEDGRFKPNPSDASKITVIYGPAGDELRPIRDALVNAKVLERLQRFLSPLRLTDKITVQTAECGPPAAGRHYSFVPYQRGKPVTICYEFVKLIIALAPEASQYGLIGHALITREMAIEGPFVQEVLHDVALAVLDQLEIPVWGNVDDAADNVAALSMLYFGSGVALKSILGSSYFLQRLDDAITSEKSENGEVVHAYDLTYLTDVRAPMLRRYYNLLCVAVGKDPVLFSSLIAFPPAKPTPLIFAWEKAQECSSVYQEAADGFKQTILDKYVDKNLLAQIASTDWYAAP